MIMTAQDDTPVTVLTGASAGIGIPTARLMAARGHRVVLVARRQERLEQLQAELQAEGHQAATLVADLADVAQAEAIVPRVLQDHGRLDVLINNAGFGQQKRFVDADAATDRAMFAVNVLSAMALARGAVPVMLAQGRGSIVNVASVGGLVSHPLNVAYCASKHALVGFSRSLRLELKGSGVSVTAVCPGATRTEFFDVARADIPFAAMIERFAVAPEVAARCIVQATTSNRAVRFPTWGAWFLCWADRWLPWFSEAGNLRYRDQVLRLARNAKGESRTAPPP